MKIASINQGNRRYFVYSFPDVADDSGNFDVTLLTDTDFYATSISSDEGFTFFLYNLSTEKQTIPTLLPLQIPVMSGSGGTPYFFPVPWKLKAGTILRLVPVFVLSQVSIAGYRA
jgi:hypothetical protein